MHLTTRLSRSARPDDMLAEDKETAKNKLVNVVKPLMLTVYTNTGALARKKERNGQPTLENVKM